MSVWKRAACTALTGSCLVLAGCQYAPMPISSNFAYSEQHKVRSAGHWDMVAQDVVQQTLAMLQQHGVDASEAVYVDTVPNASVFDQGFREFLITKLVAQHIPVQLHAQGASILLRYQTQVVVHKSKVPEIEMGKFSKLSSGLLAVYSLRDRHLDTWMGAQLGLAVFTDWLESQRNGGPTHTELILTTTALRANQYVARKTDVYYLENADAPLFLSQQKNDSSNEPSDTLRTMKVVDE